MNIFYLDHDPAVAAEYMVDKHIIKMILESAQLLSTAHRVLDGKALKIYSIISNRTKTEYKFPFDKIKDDTLYKATHVNHPSAIWVRESSMNYRWLYDHFGSLLHEYYFRYNKPHKTAQLYNILANTPINIPKISMTTIKCAMPDEFKISNDPIENYRNYYNKDKSHLHKWTKRNKPDWITT